MINLVDLTGDNVFISKQNGLLTATLQSLVALRLFACTV